MGFQEKAKLSADKATLATLKSAVAIGLANGDVPIGADFEITVSAGGVVGNVIANGKSLIEDGAVFKLDVNDNGTLKWEINANGEITSTPAINDTTGKITGLNTKS